MEISGKIIQILELVSGQGKNGTWKKQNVILETEGQYPKKVCLTLWGDNIDKWALQENDLVKASLDIESREYNGRWYTDVKVWKLEKGSNGDGPAPTDFVDEEPPFISDDQEDSLPF